MAYYIRTLPKEIYAESQAMLATRCLFSPEGFITKCRRPSAVANKRCHHPAKNLGKQESTHIAAKLRA